MTLQVAAIRPPAATHTRKQCCDFVKTLSASEFTALFYQDRQFLDWILTHAVFVSICESCALTIHNCHALMADAKFRAEAEKHLITGRKLFASFLQSISQAI